MAMELPLLLPLSSATLVFGLEWLPLLGGKAERTGLRLARQHKATQMVLAGETAGSVGITAVKTSRSQRKASLYSAAQNLAHLFPTGTVALVLELEQVGYWLVAVHEGAVVARTDRLYRCVEDTEPVLDELRQAYPQFLLLGSHGAPDQPALAAIEAACSTQSRLRVLSRWAPVLPWPVQGFVLVLVLVLLIPKLGTVLASKRQARVPVANVNPVQAWKRAVEQAAHGRVVHGARGTRALLDELYELPIHINGWVLLQTECAAQLSQWRCQARYERRDMQASNSQFLAGSPKHWTVEFISMEQAQPVWDIPGHGAGLLAQQLKTSLQNERDLFSALQAIKPAFSQMQVGKPAPLHVAAPQDDSGQPLPRPPGLAHHLSRPIQLGGPLRSASLLLPYTASMQWNKAVLSLRNIDNPGLKSSSLNLSLQGVLYEIESEPAVGRTVDDPAGVSPVTPPTGLLRP
ncbi:hypothetical protein [Pollutimonas bauzanensis]|uniref:hypothetical protein n=1 Tax=Pollutimonas bauzanensis TaxID=658167 RepID=UPI003341493B